MMAKTQSSPVPARSMVSSPRPPKARFIGEEPRLRAVQHLARVPPGLAGGVQGCVVHTPALGGGHSRLQQLTRVRSTSRQAAFLALVGRVIDDKPRFSGHLCLPLWAVSEFLSRLRQL